MWNFSHFFTGMERLSFKTLSLENNLCYENKQQTFLYFPGWTEEDSVLRLFQMWFNLFVKEWKNVTTNMTGWPVLKSPPWSPGGWSYWRPGRVSSSQSLNKKIKTSCCTSIINDLISCTMLLKKLLVYLVGGDQRAEFTLYRRHCLSVSNIYNSKVQMSI